MRIAKKAVLEPFRCAAISRRRDGGGARAGAAKAPAPACGLA